MKLNRHHSQILARRVDRAIDQYLKVLDSHTPLTKQEMVALLSLLHPILEALARDSFQDGYDVRDAMSEPDQKQVEVADKIVGDGEPGPDLAKLKGEADGR